MHMIQIVQNYNIDANAYEQNAQRIKKVEYYSSRKIIIVVSRLTQR